MKGVRFKVWNKLYCAMGEVLSINFTEYGTCYFARYILDDDVEYDSAYETDDIVTLLQYSGMEDKNGKEICRGDILHIKRKDYIDGEYHTDRLYVVDIDECSFVCRVHCMDAGIPFRELDKDLDDIEVIGNIYENPELLEEV